MWEGSSRHLLLLEACTAVEACCLARGHTSKGTGSNTASYPIVCRWPRNRICLSNLVSATPFSSATKYNWCMNSTYRKEEMGLACPSPLLQAPFIVCNCLISAEILIRRNKIIKKVEYCYQYYQNLMSDILLKLAFKWLLNDQFILQVWNYCRPLHSPPQNDRPWQSFGLPAHYCLRVSWMTMRGFFLLECQWAEIVRLCCTAGKEVVQGGRNGLYNLPVQPGATYTISDMECRAWWSSVNSICLRSSYWTDWFQYSKYSLSKATKSNF